MQCPNCGAFTLYHTVGSCIDGSTDYDHKCNQCGHEWTHKVAPPELTKKIAKDRARRLDNLDNAS